MENGVGAGSHQPVGTCGHAENLGLFPERHGEPLKILNRGVM